MQNRSAIYRLWNANLERYPFPCAELKPDIRNQLTIGDLHGNALKLIHFLVFQNVLVMNRSDYEQLVSIYNDGTAKLTKEKIDKFATILTKATANPVGLIRLIGDELADRGNNDILVLKVLEALAEKKICFEILFSNHTAVFLDNVVNKKDLSRSEPSYDGLFKSLTNLGYLVHKNIIKEDDVHTLVAKYHTPNMKLLSYSIDDTQSPPIFTLYAHAGIGLETVQELANFYNIKYADDSLAALCQTIDKINEAFTQNLSHSIEKYFSEVGQLQSIYFSMNKAFGLDSIPLHSPLCRVAWTRKNEYDDTFLPTMHNGYQLRLVHGHTGPLIGEGAEDPTKSYFKNMINLDNDHGKAGNPRANFYSLCTQDLNKLTSSVHEEKKAEGKSSLRFPIVNCNLYKVPEVQSILSKAATELSAYAKIRRNKFFSFFGDSKADAAEKIVKWSQGKLADPNFTTYELMLLADSKTHLGKIIAEAKEKEILPRAVLTYRFDRP